MKDHINLDLTPLSCGHWSKIREDREALVLLLHNMLYLKKTIY